MLEDRNLHIYCHANFKLHSLICTECVSSANKVSSHQFIYPTTLNSWYKNSLNQTVYGIYDCILIPMSINYSVCSFLPSHTCNKKPHQTHMRVVLSISLRTTEMLSHLVFRRVISPTAPYSTNLLL